MFAKSQLPKQGHSSQSAVHKLKTFESLAGSRARAARTPQQKRDRKLNGCGSPVCVGAILGDNHLQLAQPTHRCSVGAGGELQEEAFLLLAK